MIADIAGMIGMGFFLTATIRQYLKISRTHYTLAISLTHYKMKILAILCSLICFGLTKLMFSFIVVFGELIVTIGIICLIKRYRKERLVRDIKVGMKL